MIAIRLIVVLCVLVLSLSLKDIPERARGGSAAKSNNYLLQASGDAKIYKSTIDNFDNSTATFDQRYFVDNQFYKAGGPVFFEIGGEGTLGGAPAGFMATLAEEYGAALVALEHRFYGESIPNGNSNTDNLKYLTVEQALADLNSFTQWYKRVEKLDDSKWFVFGGSYPGGLASWYRAAYPDASVGSLSSSGVVNPIIDFYQFDEQVSAAIGNKCGTRLKKISRAFDKATEAKDTFKEALRLFECESDMSETDFLYMIADGWSMADQYGSKSKLCSAIMAVPEDSSSDVLMKTYAAFNNDLWGKQFCSQGFYNTAALADPARWETNARSWRWQTCYQVAWFNTAPASGSIRSQKVNLEYHLQQCATVFGEKMVPAINDINRQFGGEMPVAHKVFYSDFADDPWQRASVSYPPAEDQPYSLAMCNDCGHCMDLHAPSESDPVQLQETRNDFKTYLKKWLA